MFLTSYDHNLILLLIWFLTCSSMFLLFLFYIEGRISQRIKKSSRAELDLGMIRSIFIILKWSYHSGSLYNGFPYIRSILLQGLCLVDWGRGVDLNLFPADVEFQGDCRTSGFRCVEMQERRTWTYQVCIPLQGKISKLIINEWYLLFYPFSYFPSRLIPMAFVLLPIWCCMELTWASKRRLMQMEAICTNLNHLSRGIDSLWISISFLLHMTVYLFSKTSDL